MVLSNIMETHTPTIQNKLKFDAAVFLCRTGPVQPSLNLSHAVCVVLAQLYEQKLSGHTTGMNPFSARMWLAESWMVRQFVHLATHMSMLPKDPKTALCGMTLHESLVTHAARAKQMES